MFASLLRTIAGAALACTVLAHTADGAFAAQRSVVALQRGRQQTAAGSVRRVHGNAQTGRRDAAEVDRLVRDMISKNHRNSAMADTAAKPSSLRATITPVSEARNIEGASMQPIQCSGMLLVPYDPATETTTDACIRVSTCPTRPYVPHDAPTQSETDHANACLWAIVPPTDTYPGPESLRPHPRLCCYAKCIPDPALACTVENFEDTQNLNEGEGEDPYDQYRFILAVYVDNPVSKVAISYKTLCRYLPDDPPLSTALCGLKDYYLNLLFTYGYATSHYQSLILFNNAHYSIMFHYIDIALVNMFVGDTLEITITQGDSVNLSGLSEFSVPITSDMVHTTDGQAKIFRFGLECPLSNVTSVGFLVVRTDGRVFPAGVQFGLAVPEMCVHVEKLERSPAP